MRFNKIIKSIDYVTYPLLTELKEINQRMRKANNVVLSALVSFVINKTFIVQHILQSISEKSNCICIKKMLSTNDSIKTASSIVVIVFGLFVLSFPYVVDYFKKRWGSNKKDYIEREEIVNAFYRSVIPHLISIKSIMEQHNEAKKKEKSKKALLLMQANYEICNLVLALNKLKIIERKKDGNLKESSQELLYLIGKDVYLQVVNDICECIYNLMISLKKNNSSMNEISFLKATTSSSQALREADEYYSLNDSFINKVVNNYF